MALVGERRSKRKKKAEEQWSTPGVTNEESRTPAKLEKAKKVLEVNLRIR